MKPIGQQHRTWKIISPRKVAIQTLAEFRHVPFKTEICIKYHHMKVDTLKNCICIDDQFAWMDQKSFHLTIDGFTIRSWFIVHNCLLLLTLPYSIKWSSPYTSSLPYRSTTNYILLLLGKQNYNPDPYCEVIVAWTTMLEISLHPCLLASLIMPLSRDGIYIDSSDRR